jgi:hypothetical protein
MTKESDVINENNRVLTINHKKWQKGLLKTKATPECSDG